MGIYYCSNVVNQLNSSYSVESALLNNLCLNNNFTKIIKFILHFVQMYLSKLTMMTDHIMNGDDAMNICLLQELNNYYLVEM